MQELIHNFFVFQALRAKYEDRPSDEAWHLMKAGLWNRSHEIVLKHLAADAIIHGKLSISESDLRFFSKHRFTHKHNFLA